jgi:hypothetical protein
MESTHLEFYKKPCKALIRDIIKMDYKQEVALYLMQWYTLMNTMANLIIWVPKKATIS